MPLALARKYRPKRFSDLLVQEHVAQVLRGAVASHRVGHGYLLTGPRGVGKTTAARILAMALNCERKASANPPGEPCGECQNCLRIWNGAANLDVVEIDAASNRGVDDARDLRERAMYAASREGDHKVYIVDEAHMLTREAWNALLKILEEPPPGVVFVFATTDPHKIAQAAAPVLSRLQRFDFRRITSDSIRERLRAVLKAEGIEAEDDALVLIARQADGGMRDALSVLDQCLSFGEGKVTAAGVRGVLGLVTDEVYGELLELVADRRPAAVFPLLDRLVDSGMDLVEFAAGAAEALRALLVLQLGAKPEGVTDALLHSIGQVKDRLPAADLLRMLKLFTETEVTISRSGHPRLVIETLVLRWAMMDRTVELERVIGQGGQSGQGGQGGRTLSSAPSAPSASVPSASPAAVPSASPVPFTLTALTAAWPDLVAVARGQSRFLGDALAGSQLVSVAAPVVTLAPPEGNPILAETLERQLSAVAVLLEKAVGAPVQVQFASKSPEAASPRPRRLSEGQARAERLRGLLTKDPALEAAAEGLDLEALD